MPPPSKTDLIAEIQRLQAARQSHLDALRFIDEVLGGVAQTLGAMRGGAVIRDSSEARATSPITNIDAMPLEAARRKYNRLPQTGEDFVLSFVRGHGSPTTHDINNAWRSDGRGGVANNVIWRLLKRGVLLREPLGQGRGSRYRMNATPSDAEGFDAAAPSHLEQLTRKSDQESSASV